MKINEIDQVCLEKWVPALTSADSQIFDLIKPEIDIEKAKLEKMIGEIKVLEGAPEQVETLQLVNDCATMVVCNTAAYNMIPHINLTLTPEGFGIIRNDHITPASKERVDDLKERIRKKKSQTFDELRTVLIGCTSWRDKAEEEINLLFWCPTVCRFCGIQHGENRMYQEEYEMEVARISEAEAMLKRIISMELYNKILHFWKLEDKVYKNLREICKRLIAAYLLDDAGRNTYRMTRYELQKYLNTHIEEITEYKNSDIAKSHVEGYRNKKSDKTFFFA